MEHLKRLKEICFQLTVPLGLDILATQTNLLTRGVVLRLDSLIVGLFLKFLGIVKVLVIYDHQLSEFL